MGSPSRTTPEDRIRTADRRIRTADFLTLTLILILIPCSGQFFDEPDAVLEFELDPEPVPVDEFEDPDPVDPVLVEPVPVDPVEPVPVDPVPVDPVLELEDGVVVDVVAALATSAPPARRPDVNAPTARTFRRRICMWICPFFWVQRRFVRIGTTHGAPRN